MLGTLGAGLGNDAIVSWIESWRSQSVEELAERLRSVGAEDPAGWAGSELREDIAQTARYLFLRALWSELSGCLEYMKSQIESLAAAGSLDGERIERELASSLYVLGFNIAYFLDEPDGTTEAGTGELLHVLRDGPRWRLMEVAPGGEEGARERGWF